MRDAYSVKKLVRLPSGRWLRRHRTQQLPPSEPGPARCQADAGATVLGSANDEVADLIGRHEANDDRFGGLFGVRICRSRRLSLRMLGGPV